MSEPQPLPDDDPVPLLRDLTQFRRPRLRPEVPIMWRGQTSIQLGDDVVVERVDRSLVAWMTSLDGSQDPLVIAESLTIPEHEARRLIRALLAAGALEDAGRIPDSMRWCDADARDESRARFGALMATDRDLDHAHATADRRAAARILIAGDGPLAEHVESAMEAAGLATGVATGEAAATLVVLTDAPHPDVPAHFDNPALDRPHLHVGAFGARAIAGPIVLPGRTSCLRCAHLHRRDADPAWPLVSVQWSHSIRALRPVPMDPLLMRIVASSAALLARRMVDHPDDPNHWTGYAIEHTLPSADPVRLDRPPHPLCGCTWADL